MPGSVGGRGELPDRPVRRDGVMPLQSPALSRSAARHSENMTYLSNLFVTTPYVGSAGYHCGTGQSRASEPASALVPAPITATCVPMRHRGHVLARLHPSPARKPRSCGELRHGGAGQRKTKHMAGRIRNPARLRTDKQCDPIMRSMRRGAPAIARARHDAARAHRPVRIPSSP